MEQLADHKVEVSKSEAAHLRFFQPSKTTDTQTSWNVAYVRWIWETIYVIVRVGLYYLVSQFAYFST